jgi:hypothetical protein
MQPVKNFVSDYGAFPMPNYHFNVRSNRTLAVDQEGDNFRSFGEALEEAKASARDLAHQLLNNRVALAAACVEVTDDDGKVLAALPVDEVLKHPNFPQFREQC